MGKCWNWLNLVIFRQILALSKTCFWLWNLNRLTKLDEIFNLASTKNSWKVVEKATPCNIIVVERNGNNTPHTLFDFDFGAHCHWSWGPLKPLAWGPRGLWAGSVVSWEGPLCSLGDQLQVPAPQCDYSTLTTRSWRTLSPTHFTCSSRLGWVDLPGARTYDLQILMSLAQCAAHLARRVNHCATGTS